MKRLVFLIRVWMDWRKRVSGRVVVDWSRGCGYYLPGQFSGYSRDIGRVETHALQSGNHGTYKLLSVDTYSDPSDMIKESRWQLLGYRGQKLFSDMSFREYCDARSI